MNDPLDGQISREAWTRERCREFDREAQERRGVPGEILMENAGAAVARSTRTLASAHGARTAAIVCGAGNNGGDGLVAARQLLGSLEVRVLLLGPRARLRGDPLAQLRRLDALGIPVEEIADAARLAVPDAGKLVWVDAIFGIGLDRPVDGLPKDAIDAMNASRRPILAVDVPSGLDADTGEVLGAAIRAARTVTFVAPKVGFRRGAGPACAGEIEIVGIGVPVAPPAEP